MGGLIQLGLVIAADASQVDAAAKQAEQAADDLKNRTGAANTEVAKGARTAGEAIGDLGKKGKQAGQDIEEGMLTGRESVRLVGEEFGVHLPRGITSAISKVEGLQAALRIAGEVAVTFFAMREVAEAINNWDKFRDKITQIIGPISQLEVNVANWLGLLREYSSEVSTAAEREKKDAEAGLALAERVQKSQFELNRLRATGVQAIRIETQQHIIELQQEASKTDQVNRSYYNTLIAIEKQKGAERERQAVMSQGHKGDSKWERETEQQYERMTKQAKEAAELQSKVAGEIAKLSLELEYKDTPALLHFYERLQKINDEFGKSPLAISIVELELQKLNNQLKEMEAEWGKEHGGSFADIISGQAAGIRDNAEITGMNMMIEKTNALFQHAKALNQEWVKMHTEMKLLQPDFAQLHPAFQVLAFDLQNVSNFTQQAFVQMSDGMLRAGMAAAIYGQNVGKALEASAKASIASIAEQAGIQAINAVAQGIWLLAQSIWTMDPNAAAAAVVDFEAAAEWGLIAGAAGAAAAAIPSGAARSSAGASAYGGSRYSAGGGYGGSGGGGPQTGPYGMAPGAASAINPPSGNLTVLVVGEAQAGQWMATTLNTAVQRGVALNATTVQKAPYAAG